MIEYNSIKNGKQQIWKNLQETIFLKRIIYSMIPFIQSSRKYKTPDQWLPGDVQGATDILIMLSHRSIHWSKLIKFYALDGQLLYINSTSIKPLKIKKEEKNQSPRVLGLTDELKRKVRKSFVTSSPTLQLTIYFYSYIRAESTRISLNKNGLLSKVIIPPSLPRAVPIYTYYLV